MQNSGYRCGPLVSWWCADDVLMMHWWWTDDALMMNWWCTDDALMLHWLCTGDALMMHWWCTDDMLMMRNGMWILDSEFAINHSFTGDGMAWATSQNEFSDSECPNLGKHWKDSLQDCKAVCLEDTICTAVNYDDSSTACILRGCTLPVLPPANNKFPSFDGYWLVSSGSF